MCELLAVNKKLSYKRQRKAPSLSGVRKTVLSDYRKVYYDKWYCLIEASLLLKINIALFI